MAPPVAFDPATIEGLSHLLGEHYSGSTLTRLLAQARVDDMLALAVRDERVPTPVALSGELVAPADELVEAFAATLVARPQTQRTYERACRRLARWLGPLAGPEELTAANVARYHGHLVRSAPRSTTGYCARARP